MFTPNHFYFNTNLILSTQSKIMKQLLVLAAFFIAFTHLCIAQTIIDTTKVDTLPMRKGNGALRVGILPHAFSTFFEGNFGGKYWTGEQTAVSAIASIYIGATGNTAESNRVQPITTITKQTNSSFHGSSQILVGGIMEHHFLANKQLSPYVAGLAALGIGWYGNAQDGDNYISDGDTTVKSTSFQTTITAQREANAFLSVKVGGIVGVEYFPATWLSITLETALIANLSVSFNNASASTIKKSGISKTPSGMANQTVSDTNQESKFQYDSEVEVRPGLTVMIYFGREGTQEIIKEIFGGTFK